MVNSKKGGNAEQSIINAAYRMELNDKPTYTSYCVDNLRPSSFGGKKKPVAKKPVAKKSAKKPVAKKPAKK